MKNILLFTLSLFCVFAVRAQALPGVVAHWAMNGNAHDTSGNGHDGIETNVVPAPGINGLSNQSLYFDGVSSMIGVPYDSTFNVSKYTICAIVKPEGFYDGTCQGNTILQRGGTGSGSGNYYLYMGSWEHYHNCSIFDSTKELFSMDAEGRDAFTSGSLDYGHYVVRDTWYKVVAVFNDTDYKIYVNGALMTKATLATQGPLSTSTDIISIGYDVLESGSGYPYQFTGYIDDLILYNRPLTDSEAVHYNDTCGRITMQPTGTKFSLGGTAIFGTAASIVGATYQWQVDIGTGFSDLSGSYYYSGVKTPILTVSHMTGAMANAQFRCLISNTWGCKDTTKAATLAATGVNNLSVSNNDLHIMPNPSNGQFTIDIHQVVSNSPVRVQIINQLGQVIIDELTTENKAVVDISKYASGLYFVKVISGSNTLCKQLIKL